MSRKEWAVPTVVCFYKSRDPWLCKKHTTVWRGTIKKADGITIVTNPRSPMLGETAFSVEETLSLEARTAGTSTRLLR